MLAAAAGLALLGLLLMNSTPEPAAEHTETLIVQEPDVQAQNVEFQQLNVDGSLHYRLKAEHIKQFENDQLTRMNKPKLHLTSLEQPPWDVRSNTGHIRKIADPNGAREDVVYLHEDVHMVQVHPTSGLVTLRSEVFYIYPDRQFAETDQNVMIDTEVGRTIAAGMAADLETGKLTLSSDSKQRVHTIVLPEQFKNS